MKFLSETLLAFYPSLSLNAENSLFSAMVKVLNESNFGERTQQNPCLL